MAFTQRRHLDRVVANKGWLDKITFAVLAEDGIDQLAFAHRVVNLDVQPFAGFTQLLFALSGDVVSGFFADGVSHGQPAERSFERNGMSVDGQFCGAVYLGRNPFEQLLGELHHPTVILVGHIDLHAGEFRIVGTVHTLVAEVLTQFIYAIKTTYDQFFEVELRCNT